MKDKENKSSQSWEVSRWERQNQMWTARKVRWSAWKKAQK
jgi:hypothetical protein